jgi:hypothetical protein
MSTVRAAPTADDWVARDGVHAAGTAFHGDERLDERACSTRSPAGPRGSFRRSPGRSTDCSPSSSSARTG